MYIFIYLVHELTKIKYKKDYYQHYAYVYMNVYNSNEKIESMFNSSRTPFFKYIFFFFF